MITPLLALVLMFAPQAQGEGQPSGVDSAPVEAAETIPPLPPELKSQFLELAVLQAWAANPDPSLLDQVTVLVSLLRADPVSASSSVQRTFGDPKVPSMQPVGSSQAVFISGPPVVVLEAVKRLQALDALTPAPKVRTRRLPNSANGTEEFDSFLPPDDLSKGFGFLIVGALGLGLAAVLFLRRMTR
jgi:hypothetical protein